MKILKITVNNLTSIEGEFTIDFTKEPLRSAGLFAITGDTGAGKSTLLDAVSLALYNSAPRFDDVAENTPREDLERAGEEVQRVQEKNVVNMLRRGRKKGGCAVTFETAEGETWEAEWNIRLTRNGTYAAPERCLRRLTPKKEEVGRSEIARRIEEITHLNYAQFSRTVMLSQNSFSYFLKAKRGEKSALLEKLTGTEIYGEISQKIWRETQAAGEAVQALDNRMAGMLHDRLEAAELAELKERLNLIDAQLKTTTEAAAAVKAQLQWLKDFDLAANTLKARENEEAEAQRNVTAMRREELALARYDEVVPMQPLFLEITMRRNDIAGMKAQDSDFAAEIQVLAKDIVAGRKALDTAKERTADAAKQLAMKRPDIDRGHTVSGEIAAASEQLRKQEEGVASATKALDDRVAYLASKNEQSEKADKTVDRLQLHKQSLEVHHTMFDRFDLMKDKLGMLRTETDRGEANRRELQEKTRRQGELKLASEAAEKEQHVHEARLNALKSTLSIHIQAVRGLDSTALQQRAADSTTRLAALRHAAALWQHISEGYLRIADRRAAQKREAVELAQKQTELARAENELKGLEEAFDRVRTTVTLSNSENIQKLRKQLKEGEACPVCGATHHPYHTETERELGELLTALGKEFADLQKRTEQRRNTVTTLRETIASDAARLKADATALAETEARQKADCEEWRQCAYLDPSFDDASATVNREARRLMIEALIDNTTKAVDEAGRELANYNSHQAQINTLNEQITELTATMGNNHTYIDNLRTELRIAAAAVKDLQAQIALSEKSTGELYTDLDRMITLSGWFATWKSNPDGFRTRLGDLYSDWNRTCTELESAQRTRDLLREEIKGAEGNVVEARKLLTASQNMRNATKETLDNKHNELKRLFGNESPASATERLEKAVANAREEENDVRRAYELTKGRLQTVEGKRENLTLQLNKQTQLLRQLSEELDLAIARFNGSHSPVQFAELEQIFSENANRRETRHEIERRQKQLTLAQNNLKTARTALTDLQARHDRPAQTGEEVRPELEQKLQHLTELTNNLQEELMRGRTRLLSHENCEQRAAALAEERNKAQKNAEEWQRLNILLGSSDGKKFRTLAQGYTFGYLVEHANFHLRRLSPRYELQNIPGTLTLEIIDRDMFDRHRYVNSLSGGETFVVSLALALGLASLSGRNLAIGSLFIDEGFGNLDSDSLALVMQVLSNLEDVQGRKVGIISHTEQIRSQISPQIKLEKKPGGASQIVIG